MAKTSGTTKASSPKASFSQITGLSNPNDKRAINSSLAIVSGIADNVKLHTGYTAKEVKAALRKQLKKL